MLITSKILEQIQMYYFSLSSLYVFVVNSSRGNKYFGDCTALMTTRCLIPANREAAADTATDANTWRPPTQVSFASSLSSISVVPWTVAWCLSVFLSLQKKSSTVISECLKCEHFSFSNFTSTENIRMQKKASITAAHWVSCKLTFIYLTPKIDYFLSG